MEPFPRLYHDDENIQTFCAALKTPTINLIDQKNDVVILDETPPPQICPNLRFGIAFQESHGVLQTPPGHTSDGKDQTTFSF